MNLDVYLYYWVISDGNYDDFAVGETREFAIEFWSPGSLKKTTTPTKSLLPRKGFSYTICGELVYAEEDVWVVDFGLLAYSENINDVQLGCVVGDYVTGDVRFDVDPFFYFERMWKLPGMPALIYDWKVNSIEQDTTPLTLSEACGKPLYVRDDSRVKFNAVDCTDENLADPPDMCPAYVLHCDKIETPPRSRRIHTLESLNDC